MSANVLEVAATVLFLVIGDDTTQVMKMSTWDMLGWCRLDADSAWESCEGNAHSHGECEAKAARNLPCRFNHERAYRWRE